MKDSNSLWRLGEPSPQPDPVIKLMTAQQCPQLAVLDITITIAEAEHWRQEMHNNAMKGPITKQDALDGKHSTNQQLVIQRRHVATFLT
ncbi:hypothetical protein RRG08_026804 [Elysia crispata]|uniref:Uncharacterized protein n=1 Tax=Elysia crispata TaxID=231223 RepID=A0AAE1AQ11_9GAST|nr:hypothetical protein RRG08_026804 [Elysia crispata]